MKITSTNPSRGYEIIGKVSATTPHAIQQAVDTARAAQQAWAGLSQQERNTAVVSFIDICQENLAEIATMMAQEMGMPIKRARAQIIESFEYFREYMKIAEEALAPHIVYEDNSQRHWQIREPYGVIACITPWNFPFFNIPWQAGQALLAGNVIIYKPSEEIVLFAELIAQLIAQSSLPTGVFTIVLGDGKVGAQLVQQPVDTILFTGSTKTGQHIIELAAKNSTRVLTEMGGSSPGLVFADADVPAIINTLTSMRFNNSGQYCDGLKRLIVHHSKYDEVLIGLQNFITQQKIGDALAETTDIGPLVAERQLHLLESQVADALHKGAKIFIGGKQPVGLLGAYYELTVLTHIRMDMRVWQEEVFGPVLPVMTFDTEEEAIRLANDSMYGLTAFVFTTDKDRYQRVAKSLQAGAIAHNNALYFSPLSPFGGYKKSGNSRTNGIAGFHEMTQIKIISEEK